ncbi:YggT family protein [Geminocystis sp. NIES-3709]|uniref:YggT family protein n=1 Tax=Geminocystis sp. NIES-3709 TaxID=1617448 RepID=UPI0005FC9C6B|nr:YggT family protein [Geminocystis sp. NIES-3709]BAQ65352.1 hypothetical protein GM3709_2117 [Geminocystis sp. NIES-3709]
MSQDPYDKSNVDRRQELKQEEEAFLLQKEERRLKTGQQNSSFVWILNSIYILIGFLEVLLTLRFFLRFTGANTENQFTQFIYNLSDPFIAPFSTLFISPVTEGGSNPVGGANVFDLNVLVAIVVYALLGWIGVSFIKYIYAR